MNGNKLKYLQIGLIVLLLVSIFVSIDLGLNFVYSIATEGQDSIACNSILQSVLEVFGDTGWSILGFFGAFRDALWFTFGVIVANAVVCIIRMKERK